MARFAAIGVLTAAIILVVACGTSATPTATPGRAATATSAGAVGASPAASPVRPTFVNGTIQSITADKLTLDDGESFAITTRTSYVRQVPVAPGDLMTGMYVGIRAKRQADNTLLASVVDVFGQPGTGSQFPMGGGDLMTNATIDKVEGDTLTVSFPGGGALVKLAPDAQLYRDQPATAADARPGGATTVIVTNGTAAAIRVR